MSQNTDQNYQSGLLNWSNTQINGDTREDSNSIEGTKETIQSVITPVKENLPFGDLLQQSNRTENTLRIFLKNINGLKANNSWDKWDNGCEEAYSQKIDIFGICESNINWNTNNRMLAKAKCQKAYGLAMISTSSSNESTKTEYQPGGTATIITGKYTGRVTQPIQDLSGMGRWSGYKLRRNSNSCINIITVYRPTVSSGIHTTYQQQVLDDLTDLITE